MRNTMKVGLDDTLDAEFVLIKDASLMSREEKLDNFWHGNPEKYRLTNFTESAVKDFFDAYHAGKLPTYWASREEAQRHKKRKPGQLASWNFEEFVYNADKKSGVMVAFFNDDPKGGCEKCKHGREV